HARIGGRHHRLPALAQDGLGRDLERHSGEGLEVRGADAVPAADLCTPRTSELCVCTEAGAADPDEPEAATLHGLVIATSSSAISHTVDPERASTRSAAEIAAPKRSVSGRTR